MGAGMLNEGANPRITHNFIARYGECSANSGIGKGVTTRGTGLGTQRQVAGGDSGIGLIEDARALGTDSSSSSDSQAATGERISTLTRCAPLSADIQVIRHVVAAAGLVKQTGATVVTPDGFITGIQLAAAGQIVRTVRAGILPDDHGSVHRITAAGLGEDTCA